MYSPFAYFIAKSSIDNFIQLLDPMLTVLIEYWAVGLSNAAGAGTLSFFQIYLVLMLVGQVGIGFGLSVSAVCPSIQIANSILYVFGQIFILFAGLLANSDTIPSWLAWL